MKRLLSNDVRRHFDETVAPGTPYVERRWFADGVRAEQYLQTRDALIRAIGSMRAGLAVEVGAGPCVWTPLLAARADRAVAFDLSRGMLQGATDAGTIPLRCVAEASRLPLSTAKVDLLATVRAFEYFPDKPAALEEFRRVVRPGGRLILVTKNPTFSGYGRAASASDLHQGNVDAATVARMVVDAGFPSTRVLPVVFGRSRVRGVWRALRQAGNALRPEWPDRIPFPFASIVESYAVIAS